MCSGGGSWWIDGWSLAGPIPPRVLLLVGKCPRTRAHSNMIFFVDVAVTDGTGAGSPGTHKQAYRPLLNRSNPSPSAPTAVSHGEAGGRGRTGRYIVRFYADDGTLVEVEWFPHGVLCERMPPSRGRPTTFFPPREQGRKRTTPVGLP